VSTLAELRSFFSRRARALLAIGFLALLVQDIFGQHGFLAMRRTQREIQTLEQEIQQLKQDNEDNRKLAEQVKALKSDPTTIERIAREEMGLARRGELIFKLPRKPREPAAADKPDLTKK